MDSFRTELLLPERHPAFGMKDRFLTMGSCFANAIGSRLEQFKFSSLTNPFGTTFNPVSIHRQLQWATLCEFPSGNSYASHDELFFNYHFHSQFSSLDKSDLQLRVEDSIRNSHLFLKSTSCILITYGTAWVYQLKKEKEIVANCHKQPSSQFEKRFLTQNEIEESFTSVYELICKLNPAIKIILTVSPVRHIKDTLQLNSLSKSLLRVACHSLAEKFQHVEYFPAFEIMMDDLRDYRFYKQDRIHPTDEAEEYIWEKFIHSHFDQKTLRFIDTWKEIQSALSHKPFHPQSKKHQEFLKGLLVKLEELKAVADTEKEIKEVRRRIGEG